VNLSGHAREALERAYTYGHTSFESEAYTKGDNDIVSASKRGRIIRNADGSIVVPDFAMCTASETRRSRSGTTNTICTAIEVGNLLAAAESKKPALHVVWLRAAYHPMDNSGAREAFKAILFDEWKNKRAKTPSRKLAGQVASMLDDAFDWVGYFLRTDSELFTPKDLCAKMAGNPYYGRLWNECPKAMNYQRDIKPELLAMLNICADIDRKALQPVWDVLSKLKGNLKECA